MPTLFKMSSEKGAIASPTVVLAETTPTASPRKTKKYVIIAVSAVASAAIVLAAILIGMYFFTEAQKEIVKYTLTFSNNAKQDVTSDPNENVVQYHVSTPQQETWIVNDFNKDIQVVKIQKNTETKCYVNALNRSAAMDPSKVAKPESSDIKDGLSMVYRTSETPISDTSFLSKTARDMCRGVSIYWVFPQCLDKNHANKNITDVNSRKKRVPSLHDRQWGSQNKPIWSPGSETADVYSRKKRDSSLHEQQWGSENKPIWSSGRDNSDVYSRKKRDPSLREQQWGSENKPIWSSGKDATDVYSRKKREAPYYDYWYWNGNACVGGCCAYICACEIDYYYYVDSDGYIHCTWHIYDCDGNPTSYSPAYGCYDGPDGLTCPNYSNATWSTC